MSREKGKRQRKKKLQNFGRNFGGREREKEEGMKEEKEGRGNKTLEKVSFNLILQLKNWDMFYASCMSYTVHS